MKTTTTTTTAAIPGDEWQHRADLTNRAITSTDWEQVVVAMKATNWRWAREDGFRVPTMPELMEQAWRLCMEALRLDTVCSTGGLFADGRGGRLELSFRFHLSTVARNDR